jgi:hypothetical protein
MIREIKLNHCRRLIEDIKRLSVQSDIEDIMPHILRSAVILFSAEMEDNLKKMIAIGFKHYPFVVKNVSIHDIRNFFKEVSRKARNPKYRDIKKLVEIFGITLSTIGDDEKEFYSNFIEKRDRIAHNPQESIPFSFQDFESAVEIGEKILNYISQSLFEKITEHIKGEFF